VNVFRPGGVDTEMQIQIRSQDPARVGAALYQRFIESHQRGTLLSPEQSAASPLPRLASFQTGQIRDASDSLRTTLQHPRLSTQPSS
jgi:hypothetical protein